MKELWLNNAESEKKGNILQESKTNRKTKLFIMMMGYYVIIIVAVRFYFLFFIFSFKEFFILFYFTFCCYSLFMLLVKWMVFLFILYLLQVVQKSKPKSIGFISLHSFYKPEEKILFLCTFHPSQNKYSQPNRKNMVEIICEIFFLVRIANKRIQPMRWFSPICSFNFQPFDFSNAYMKQCRFWFFFFTFCKNFIRIPFIFFCYFLLVLHFHLVQVSFFVYFIFLKQERVSVNGKTY